MLADIVAVAMMDVMLNDDSSCGTGEGDSCTLLTRTRLGLGGKKESSCRPLDILLHVRRDQTRAW